MTTAENRAYRARETLVVLTEQASATDPIKASDVWQRVVSRIPLERDEAELNPSGKQRGWAAWVWQSDDLVKSGWIRQDPADNGLWYPTAESRKVLDDLADPIEFAREARARYAAWARARKDTQRKLLASVVLADNEGQERIREATGFFVTQGLQAGDSVFAPGRHVWNSSASAELVTHFVEARDESGGSFVEKLKSQMQRVSEDARLLMAELVTWQLLPIYPDTIGEQAKLKRIEAVLGTMDHPVQVPELVRSALDTGTFNPGQRMATSLHIALSIIVQLVDRWFALTAEERAATLSDAVQWRAFVLAVPGEDFPTQRNSLLYLVRPDFFGPIVSREQKLAIRETFIGEIGGSSGDLERDILDITVALQVKAGGPVNFYDEPYRARWDQTQTQPHPVEPLVSARFPVATSELARKLFMDESWLQKTLGLLERRNQIILYGPPGTGKTYLARELANHIAGGSATTGLVQFHPSYSYEDFFEGFRPTTVDGALTYELRPGPMKRVADKARANKELNYVLFIDEINRGNLAKIFGELYFLLEYRDESVSLLYGQGEKFTLPSNVFIIGTMNTSDRSIALMDAAMRRRFAFVELHPSQLPTSDVLPRWLREHGLSAEPADLLAELNSRIDDESFQIGPSYLMDKQLDLSETRLAEIWEYEILPLLDEHHFGDGVDVSRKYGLPALRRALANVPADIDALAKELEALDGADR
ncbi:AAA family ATPase [Salinibacterium sp. ZJ454]|uniref:McrB family protein n=1 Tax=Salinibacterium sp. ZJ454 TaxID=2708339 RepID=UPI0014219AC7|nr:AAA family ATPase [Salinibacterium sp. ZJ454]